MFASYKHRLTAVERLGGATSYGMYLSRIALTPLLKISMNPKAHLNKLVDFICWSLSGLALAALKLFFPSAPVIHQD